MAEFLIYNKDHWMDKLNQEEYDKLMAHLHGAEKFLSRYQKGDIVEVQEDGFYTSTLKGNLSRWPFRVVSIPGVKPDKRYMEPIMDGDVMLKRRRFNISTGTAQKVTTVASMNDLALTDKNG